MSIKLIREVFEYAPADLTPAERLVLLAIAEDAREDRVSRYAKRERLMQRCGLSAGHLKRAIRSLEAAGLIQRVGTAYKGHNQEYRVAQLQAHHQATNVHLKVVPTPVGNRSTEPPPVVAKGGTP